MLSINIVSVGVIFGGVFIHFILFYFIGRYVGGRFIPVALVGGEMITVNSYQQDVLMDACEYNRSRCSQLLRSLANTKVDVLLLNIL